MNRDNPEVIDLAGLAELARAELEQRGQVSVIALGGAIGALLARQGDQGTRAWTLAAACEHHGVGLDVGLACFAVWRGCYEAWAVHAADLRQAELAGAQLELPR